MALMPQYPKGQWEHTTPSKPVDPFNLLEPFFNNWTIGFSEPFQLMRQLHAIKPSTQYPPYNILETGENSYEIQVAVAGLSKADLDITLEGERLTIKSNNDKEDVDKAIHKGIASRDFTQTFILAPDIIIKDAKMDNGLLTISLEREIPESLKPKAIKIK